MKIREIVKTVMDRQYAGKAIGGFDLVGNVAVIIIPEGLEDQELTIAKAILESHRNIKTVAKRDGCYEGEFRTIGFKVIAGEELQETEHRENGVRFLSNPAEVYYSVRSGHERKRVASLVRPGEEILVMFSGIGAFPLVIAANSEARQVIGIEKNPAAHRYAQKSLRLNRRIKNTIFYYGDVQEIVPEIGKKFHRVLMPLPGNAEKYLEVALQSVRTGGMLHFYDFQNKNTFGAAEEKVKRACLHFGRLVVDTQTVVCGHCSPRSYRICVDARIK